VHSRDALIASGLVTAHVGWVEEAEAAEEEEEDEDEEDDDEVEEGSLAFSTALSMVTS
jgi:hypothetical protein